MMDGLAELLPPLAEDRPGIGHNQPPLSELLVEETVDLKKRADDLVAAAGRADVSDEDAAGRATLLVKMMTDHAKAIEERREERKRPFLEAGRTVDGHFAAIRLPLVGPDAKKLGGKALEVKTKVDAYRRKKEEEAAAERRRLEDEARKQREAAEAAERERQRIEAEARRAAEEAERRVREAEEAARRANDRAAAEKARREREAAEAERKRQEAATRERQLQAEIERRQREEAAAALEQKAAMTVAAPIDTGYGVKAHTRKNYSAVITDLTAAIRHCRKVDEAAIREAVQKIYDRQVRAGVRELPGADVVETTTTQIR